ncbi:hypothetical protein CHS0354_003587 [Potamilus streckersoni]|uniref:Uncharacterized protein n=1 Tax=Potamilus streckersoni TaxID=2493646 RepID=A0AAE0SMW2_9BIVA|nr:hypothetical protein CHS0354_003587 [Potamilus streckersoni]
MTPIKNSKWAQKTFNSNGIDNESGFQRFLKTKLLLVKKAAENGNFKFPDLKDSGIRYNGTNCTTPARRSLRVEEGTGVNHITLEPFGADSFVAETKWLENIPGLKVDGFDFTAKYEEAVNQYLHETYLIPAKGGGRHGGKSYYS